MHDSRPLSSAATLARALRARDATATALVTACLSRIERFNPSINAVVWLQAEAALERARAADAAADRGDWWGPLHGVPITVKECFDWSGSPSTFGRPSRAAHRPSANAAAVQRLVDAGAILLGKTNVPVDLADWQSFNPLYGMTRNPWSEAHSPGGSSGGAAAALATGMSALELGSDHSGSIRMPAHFCGVYGHKPTYGIVPVHGHWLVEGSPPDDLNVVGPLARSAEDLDLALRVLAGPLPAQARAWSLSLPDPGHTRVAGLRIAVLTTDALFPVDEATRSAARSIARVLTGAGATVEVDPALPAPSRQCYELSLALARAATAFRRDAAEIAAMRAQADRLDPDDRGYEALMLRGLTQSHRDWLERQAEREHLRRAWATFFERHDLLVAPVSPTAAFEHIVDTPKAEQRLRVDGVPRPMSDAYFWIGLASAAGLPSTVIPAGQSADGRPIGLQIIGPEYHDLRGIALARALESLHRGFKAPPGYA